MHFIDWIFVAAPLVVVVIVGVYAQRRVKSVAGFMSANRCAGRYLLCIAGGELQTGAVVFVALFELFAHGGFAVSWWTALVFPVTYLIRVTGFVSYRYRETRAMTLGQFFEIRYSKSFRLFAGLLGFFSGLLNFGIIPAIGARVLVYFLGLPETVRIFSGTVPTYVPLMALFLGITLFVALSGGVVTVMLINTLEGIITQVLYLVVIFALLAIFTWPEMRGYLLHQPPGQSLVNPFDTAKTQDFNLWFVLMALALNVYSTMAWQNSSGYNSAGLTPHEGRMAGILTSWRELGKGAVLTLLALCALTYLHDPAFAAGAARVGHAVAQVSDPQSREQMEVPIALAFLLPIGVKGIFCVILLMGVFGGDATHLHSWGTIFVQDFFVPLRRRPFGPRAHLRLLRASITGVALFAFFFGAFFHMNDYIIMWWTATGAVFLGGAGSALIGGLYWKKGTAAGAWAAFITGSVLSCGGIIAQQVEAAHGHTFFLNGTQIGFFGCLAAVVVYVATSLLTCREDFNLDRMLHRGEYAAIKQLVGDTAPVLHRKIGWGRLMGLDDTFTRGDRWIAGTLFAWSLFWLAVFVVGTAWNLIAPWSAETWARYYYITGIGLPIFLAGVTGVWFTWGGVRDMRAFFQKLDRDKINVLDDGTVVNHQNLDEAVAEKIQPVP
jgi:SSS family solute:Na+ symporter